MEKPVQIYPALTGLNCEEESNQYRLSDLLRDRTHTSALDDSAKEKIKQINKLEKFGLPPEINEYFLTFEDAPLYWLSDSSLNKYLRNFYKYHLPNSRGSNLYASLREAYSRWLLIEIDSEKKYFASTLLNMVESSSVKWNFLGLLLSGIIYIYDHSLYNPLKALENFKSVGGIINSISFNPVWKNEIEYLLALYSSFAYIKLNQFDEASYKVINALTIKPGGITAGFYKAVINIRLKNFEAAEYLLRALFNQEMERLEFALHNYNLPLLKYLIEHPALQYLKKYPEFEPIADTLQNDFELIIRTNAEKIQYLRDRTDRVLNLNILQVYSAEIDGKIKFISDALKLADNNNIYLAQMTEPFEEEFISGIREVIAIIKNAYALKVKEGTRAFDDSIQEKALLIDQLTAETIEKKSKLKEKLKKTIQSIDSAASGKITDYEEKLMMLNDEGNSKTQKIFMQTIGYNLLVTMLVTFMGGCAVYSKSSINDVNGLKVLLSASLMTGFKWGIITFLTGLLIALFISGLSMVERTNKKQRLIRRISRIKAEKEQVIQELKKEADLAERSFDGKFRWRNKQTQ